MSGTAKMRMKRIDGASPVVLTGARSVTVRCLEGALWATADGGRELALSRGQTGTFALPGKVILLGMPEAEAVVELG